MKLFNNVPWKGWRTRKISFVGVCLIWLIYAVLGMFEVEIEEPVLEFVYKAGVWILGFGTALVTADKVSELLLKIFGKESEEQ